MWAGIGERDACGCEGPAWRSFRQLGRCGAGCLGLWSFFRFGSCFVCCWARLTADVTTFGEGRRHGVSDWRMRCNHGRVSGWWRGREFSFLNWLEVRRGSLCRFLCFIALAPVRCSFAQSTRHPPKSSPPRRYRRFLTIGSWDDYRRQQCRYLLFPYPFDDTCADECPQSACRTKPCKTPFVRTEWIYCSRLWGLRGGVRGRGTVIMRVGRRR